MGEETGEQGLGVDLVHGDPLERRHVDSPFGEDRLHPLRRPPDPGPGLFGVLGVPELHRHLPALPPARDAVARLRKDVAHLVTFRGDPALELAPEVLAALLLAGRHLGLGLPEEVGQLADVEAGKVNVCHGGVPRVVGEGRIVSQSG